MHGFHYFHCNPFRNSVDRILLGRNEKCTAMYRMYRAKSSMYLARIADLTRRLHDKIFFGICMELRGRGSDQQKRGGQPNYHPAEDVEEDEEEDEEMARIKPKKGSAFRKARQTRGGPNPTAPSAFLPLHPSSKGLATDEAPKPCGQPLSRSCASHMVVTCTIHT